MAISKQKIISSIVLQLTQSSPSDDIKLENDHIAYELSNALNDLVRKEIYAEQKSGNRIPPIYIKRVTGLELDEESVTDLDEDKQRIYATLPEETLDGVGNDGIIRVLDFDLNQIYASSVETASLLGKMRFARPTSDNKTYYKQGQLIFIEGFKSADLEFNPIIVDYIPKQDVLAMADDDPILISDQLVPVLTNQIISIFKFMLYGTQPDTASDGESVNPTAYHLGIGSPGQPASPDTQPA